MKLMYEHYSIVVLSQFPLARYSTLKRKKSPDVQRRAESSLGGDTLGKKTTTKRRMQRTTEENEKRHLEIDEYTYGHVLAR
jgi:hypothetical protein